MIIRYLQATDRFELVDSSVALGAQFATRWLLRRVVEAGFCISGDVVDLGCGKKPYETLFSFDRYIGVDWPRSLRGDNAPDVFADVARPPFKSGTFDSVVCTEVLEHLPEPQAALHEMNRIMKPAGCLLLTVPFLRGVHESPHDYFRFTPHGLEQLLSRSGFEIERLMTRGGATSVLVDSYARLAGSLVRRLGLRLALPKGARRLIETLLVHWPQRAAAKVLFSLYNKAPRLASSLDASASSTLGYVLVVRKKPHPG